MKGKIVSGFLVTVFLLMSIVSYAQKPPEPKPDGPIHPEFPIDSGLSYLLIVGAAYGVYAIRKKIYD
jgi:hypothetical protein